MAYELLLQVKTSDGKWVQLDRKNPLYAITCDREVVPEVTRLLLSDDIEHVIDLVDPWRGYHIPIRDENHNHEIHVRGSSTTTGGTINKKDHSDDLTIVNLTEDTHLTLIPIPPNH